MIQELEYTLKSKKENSELMYGPIFVEYLRNICKQVNSRDGTVDIRRAEDDIEIEGAYAAYMAGVRKHSEYSLSKLEKVDHPDNN